LINPDGQTIDSFGFDAEDKYAELVEKGQHNDWYFFERFKMQLYDKIVSIYSIRYIKSNKVW
jgi:hypothetical protein